MKREALLQIHLNYHDGLFIFSDLFGIDLNFYYSVLHVSASSPDHMQTTFPLDQARLDFARIALVIPTLHCFLSVCVTSPCFPVKANGVTFLKTSKQLGKNPDLDG